jgi:pimeloyl-ACP methyl ester carboxylesterase
VRWELEHDEARLAGLDFGGAGPSVLLLHGLGGRADEWAATAAGLADRARVNSFDARGHGDSERRPADVTPAAHVADAAFVIQQRGLAPATVVGQSYGGLIAFMLAAARPELVERLVVAEATPEPGDRSIVDEFERALRAGPADWASGVTEGDEEVIVQTLREAVEEDRWELWGRIRCPTLVVRGERGEVSRDGARRMVDRLGDARLVELPGAGHNLHLDRPREWLDALRGFLPAQPPV